MVVAVLMAVSSVEAQRAATNAGQSIIFSSLDNNEISSNLTSLSTQPAPPADFRSVFQDASPVPSFNNFPAGPAPIPSEGRRLKKSSDQRQDWVFMTPAEIMGVTPEKMFNFSKQDADSRRQESLTPMERYLERQSQPARTNSYFFPPGDSSSSQGFWGNGSDRTNGVSSDPIGSRFGNERSTLLNQSLNAAPDENSFAGPNGDSGWSRLFGSPAPAPAPAPNLAQRASMDQFRQLLDPNSAPITAATTLSDSTTSFKAQTVLSDADSTQPLVNPMGASFAPLSSGIGEPASLTPIPSITRQISVQPSATPTWAPQPAPWMSTAPQPFAVPQRKF
jgi:hypothetical protein